MTVYHMRRYHERKFRLEFIGEGWEFLCLFQVSLYSIVITGSGARLDPFGHGWRG